MTCLIDQRLFNSTGTSMFIHVTYKDPPELSLFRKMIATTTDDTDESVEKTLLVNPICPVRVMLEFIRNRCKLGKFTIFDLCDETGGLKGLFQRPSWVDASDCLMHRKMYYIIVLRTEGDKQLVLPQINREQPLYRVLADRVNRFLSSGEPTFVQQSFNKGRGSASGLPGKNKAKKKGRASDS